MDEVNKYVGQISRGHGTILPFLVIGAKLMCWLMPDAAMFHHGCSSTTVPHTPFRCRWSTAAFPLLPAFQGGSPVTTGRDIPEGDSELVGVFNERVWW